MFRVSTLCSCYDGFFQVKGVTARELCHFFFAPEFRMEWETTVEQATVLEKIAPDTLIFLQVSVET